MVKEVNVKMKYMLLAKIWCFVAISFIGSVLGLTTVMVIRDINILTKPLPTLIALSFIITIAILLFTGLGLLERLKKAELKNG